MTLDSIKLTNKTVAAGGGGDMTKAVYDPNDDGVVVDADHAANADYATEAGFLTDMTALQAQELVGGGVTVLHSHAATEPAPIGARVYRDSNQTIATGGAGTKLSFNQARLNLDGIFDVADPTKLTIHTDGIYLIVAQVEWVLNTNGVRYVDILLNNTNYISIESRPGAGFTAYMHATTIYPLKAGDYLEVLVYQNSGGNLDVVYETQASPEFSIQRIAAWTPPA